MAYDTLYVREIVNECNTHTNGDATPHWKYNDNNRLPPCIRK